MPENAAITWSPLFEAYFDGQNVAPGRIRSKDLAEVMTAIEDLIAVMVSDAHPDLVCKDSVVVGLKSINSGSLSLSFDTNDTDLPRMAITELQERFSSNELIKLPLEARKRLENILKFLRKYNCSFNARSLVNPGNNFFSLDLDTEIPYAQPIVGETVLYGRVTRVGGAKSPKIQFKLISGQTIHCETSRTMVVKAARQLYKEIGLRGEASWNIETYAVESFNATEIIPYEKKDIVEGFDFIRECLGDAFDHIEDADEFIRDLRSN